MKKSDMLKGVLAAAVLAAGLSTANAEERVLWISIGDGLGNSSASARQTTIDNGINFAVDNGFNAVSILARYRANAFYIPNRDFDTYTNNEPRAYSGDFDELQYTIDSARAEGLRVYAAWSAFLVTDGSNTFPSFLEDDWRMHIYQGSSPATEYSPDSGFPRPMLASDPEASGLWVDPGIPEVRDYTITVLLDLVKNYDIDGVILDRIRFPGDSGNRFDRSYGYTPDALAAYGLTDPAPSSTAFIQARRDAITTFLSDASAAIYDIKPWVIVGATPIIFGTSTVDTYNFVYQDIPGWSSAPNPNHVNGLGAVDVVMPQYYRTGIDSNNDNIIAMNAMRPDVENMVHKPIFQTFLGPTLPGHVADSICETRQQAADAGWGIFSVNSLVGMIDDINDENTTPCGTDVIATPAPANFDYDLKVGFDATVPGSIGTPVAESTLLPGRVTVFWSSASNAYGYYVYRSTSSPVAETYDNLLTFKPHRGTNFYDFDIQDGVTYHYRVVPVSAWNVRGPGGQTSVVANVPTEIVQSRPGPSHAAGPGANVSTLYQETGSFSDSSVVSSATGVEDFGSRFTTTIGSTGSFSPPISTAGFYAVDVTLHPASSHNANADFEINATHAEVTGQILLNGPAIGNTWTSLVSTPVYFADGTDPFDDFVLFENLDGNDATTGRMNMDSVRFRLKESYPLARAVTLGEDVTLMLPARASGTITVIFNEVTGSGNFSLTEVYDNSNAADAELDVAELIDQSFEVTVSSGVNFDTATVTFTYDPAQLNGLTNDANGLNAVFAVDGTTFTKYDGGDVSFDYGNNTVTIINVDGFSTWYIGNEDAEPAATSVEDWMIIN